MRRVHLVAFETVIRSMNDLSSGDTSINVRGEPIIERLEDAFRCFMGKYIEWLVAGKSILKEGERIRRSLATIKMHSCPIEADVHFPTSYQASLVIRVALIPPT